MFLLPQQMLFYDFSRAQSTLLSSHARLPRKWDASFIANFIAQNTTYSTYGLSTTGGSSNYFERHPLQ